MSKLIIVCGLSGSGKTTLANGLSKKLNVVCLHKDTIKVGLFEKLNFCTPDAYKLYFYLIEEQLKNEVDLIIESPFIYEQDIKILKDWLKKYRIDLLCVVCNIDDKTRKERIENRPRHECHKEADKNSIKNLKSQVHTYSDLPGKIINLETNKSTDILINEVINEIKSLFP